MKSLSVSCTVHDGKLKLFERYTFDEGLKAFGDGEELTLTIEPAEQRRTNAQNKFFHGPVLAGFMTLGYGKQEAKDMLALRFLPQEVRQMDGTVVLVPGHTSALTKEQFVAFIEECIQLAAENEIVIEDADVWRAEEAKRAKKGRSA